ncbi:MAG: CaiB/BaiF CoA transferase family protein, partial [Candidatus Limnocylindrales bacterium]
MSESTAGPLAGLIVCDLSTVLAGPYCTMLLADLGADVTKVEPPGGDGTRAWGPPFAGAPEPGLTYQPDDPRAEPGYRGESAYYLSVNRNKRGLRLDLKADAGREVLRRLLVRADVLVENFRVGGFARLGFPDEELEGLNPRLVHLAISGYGTDGPLAERPGYDFIVQAVAGLMSLTGHP